MPLSEWHPFNHAELSRVPDKPGVYVLYQVQIPIYVGGTEGLRGTLQAAKRQFGGATHFSVEYCDSPGRLKSRLAKLKKELRLVRSLAFRPRPDEAERA